MTEPQRQAPQLQQPIPERSQVLVIRPSELEVGVPGYIPSLAESPLNIFRMEIDASQGDERRMSWSFQAPGSNLILSPFAYITTDWLCDIPANFDLGAALGPSQQFLSVSNVDADTTGTDAAAPAQNLEKGSVMLSFSEMDGFSCAIDSVNYVINGCSVSHSGYDRYLRSYLRCTVPPKVAQYVWAECGGPQDECKTQCVSGAHTAMAGNNTQCVEGYVGDMGVCTRRKNLWDAQIRQAAHVGAVGDVRRVTIRVIAPLLGAVFNPCTGMSGLSKASYLAKMPFGLANMSNVSITMLFKDLSKSLFRVLGGDRRAALAPNNSGQFANAGGSTRDFSFILDGTKPPRLTLSYIRLGPHRAIRDSYSLATFRGLVHPPTSVTYTRPCVLPAVMDHDGKGKDVTDCLVANGKGFEGTCRFPGFSDRSYAVAKWSNIVFASPPEYLMITAEKDSEVINQIKQQGLMFLRPTMNQRAAHRDYSVTTYNGAAVARRDDLGQISSMNYALNMDNLLSAYKFELRIQSTIGSYTLTSDAPEFRAARLALFRDVLKNCHNEYYDINQWSDRKCTILLHSSQYMRGLSSHNVSFPITCEITVTYQNQAVYIDGNCAYTADAIGAFAIRDIWKGEPVVVGFYSNLLQISTASAVLTSTQYSAATADSIIQSQ